MPKKISHTKKQLSQKDRPSKRTSDFFFFTSVSVFAALTIFASQYMLDAKKEAIAAQKAQEALQVAELDFAIPSPSPTPLTIKVQRPTPYPSASPVILRVAE